ncbi:MAG: PKD domain-containing protein [Gracilimonas sp.]|uniref:PKD domain-containing protein n=1 Tax=Gracilimonas sp. TaxID=1974203 RepID=UPI00375039EC|nr:PKD domain-containing protein [Gracilimonas sp.]
MKTLIQIRWLVAALLLIGLGACEPQISSDPSLDPAPTSDNVTFEFEPDGDNANVIHFTNTSESFKAIWNLGNGQTAEGDKVIGEYPLKGEYTVTLTIFTASGQAMNTTTITIDETNPLMLDDPNLNMLTGGAGNLDGKTWVIDSTQAAHMGVGPTTSYFPEWWAAPPEAKTGSGLYNDRYTFKLDGFTYEMETNGDVFLNAAYDDEFENTTIPPDGADLMAPWTAPDDQTFNLIEEGDGDLFLKVSDPAFIGFYAGTQTYQVLELTENLLSIRYEDPRNGIVWYHRLIPEGYTYPVVELPYTSEELLDNFDEEGNIVWTADEVAEFNESYDNPAPVPVNTSAKVAKYVKDTGQFENVYTDLEYNINLNERSIVRLKVYMPSYNDYDTVDPNAPDWSPTKQLTKQVEVKLHDTKNPAPWENQAAIIQPVAETDTWVELEFDFSGWSDSDIYDKIIIQIGGEAHGMPGIFFIDDVQFTGAQ